MKQNDEKDKSMGIVRSSAGAGRVAIQGGAGKRLVTPRNMQMSDAIAQKSGHGGGPAWGIKGGGGAAGAGLRGSR